MCVLKCMTHKNTYLDIYDEPWTISSQIECVKSRHLWLHDMTVDLSVWNLNGNPSLRMITFENRSYLTKKMKNNSYNGKIETLRLVGVGSDSKNNICENEKLIESLNFHNSVKNLTIRKILSNLLSKKDYYNLINLNILLSFNSKEFVPLIFKLLKQQAKILKHQFGQLNIGLKYGSVWYSQQHIDILQWDDKFDPKLLDAKQKEWNKLNQSQSEFELNLEKYNKLKNQLL